MAWGNDPDRDSLFESIAERAYEDTLRGEYALLGTYLPEPVLRRAAELCGETLNGFDFPGGEARLRLTSPLLSRVLDDVRDFIRPNRRWCVLVRNIVHLFDLCRGSLGGADLSGLDLTETDLSRVLLSAGDLSARLDGSLVCFDSFLCYRFPGLAAGEEPPLALDGGTDGLEFIRRRIADAREHLATGGHLLFEAYPAQMDAIKLEFEKYKYNDIIIKKDLAGRDRVIAGCYSGKD